METQASQRCLSSRTTEVDRSMASTQRRKQKEIDAAQSHLPIGHNKC